MDRHFKIFVDTVSTILLICTVSSESQTVNISSVMTYFSFYPVQNAINESLTVKTYEKRYSVSHCCMTCSVLSTPSFYFVGQTNTCVCSNESDNQAVLYDTDNSIVYGFQQNLTRLRHISECQALYDKGHRSEESYTISPDGTQFYCNLSDLGWTVFQRRENGSVDFYRNWLDYVGGFGDTRGEFWMGLETIHQQTKSGCELHIYMEADPNSTVQRGYTRYSYFSVGSAATNYTLYVHGYNGDVGDSLGYSNGSAFSTFDMDNDAVIGNSCADIFKGAWWFYGCSLSDLNGEYIQNGTHDLYGRGVVWTSGWGHYYSLKKSEMAFRC